MAKETTVTILAEKWKKTGLTAGFVDEFYGAAEKGSTAALSRTAPAKGADGITLTLSGTLSKGQQEYLDTLKNG